MGGSEWTDWKILIDMIIKQNTTRPIHKSVASDVAALQSIRHLTVDLNIFGGAPAYIVRIYSLNFLVVSSWQMNTCLGLRWDFH